MIQSSAVTPVIRRANRKERDAVSRLVGEVFMDDPVSRWVFPDEGRRRVVHSHFFRPFADAALRDGWIDVTDDFSAAALWVRVPEPTPGVAGHGDQGENEEDELAAVMAAADPGNERIGIVGKLTSAAQPRDRAYYYLPAIVVEAPHQGRGVGTALIARVLERCDREGVGAYLEASSARSKSLYERLGFVSTGETVDLPDGPTMWPMWREPRS